MIALKNYINNLFEDFEIDNPYNDYILIDLPSSDIYEGGTIEFNFDVKSINGDIPVLFCDIDRIKNYFKDNRIMINDTHKHLETLHLHFNLYLTKVNIDKIHSMFFDLQEIILK